LMRFVVALTNAHVIIIIGGRLKLEFSTTKVGLLLKICKFYRITFVCFVK
jgi:hypothetical protein